jgi:predicted methyltransferase
LAEASVIVRDVAAAVGLAEGEPGVRAVLSALARLEPVSIRVLSRTVELPVPIVASICGELRKRQVVAERRPAQLTAAGRDLFAAGALTLRPSRKDLSRLSADLRRISRKAPPPVLELDQCHCTADTKVRRVLAMHEADALVGRRILLLGDDDLTSVAIRAFVERFGSQGTIAEITVIDVDSAVVAFVRRQLSGAPFRYRCIAHDVREPLPPPLASAFDTVVTDPPYTVPATRLFLARAAQALNGAGGDVFFSFGSRRPEASFHVQRTMLELGFAIRGLVRDFNEYVGAGVLGGTSHLYHLVATSDLQRTAARRFDGALYTGEPATSSAERPTVPESTRS